MFVVCVRIEVTPGHEEDFVRATASNHEGTRKEAGNLRFDVLRQLAEPRKFFLYEVYRDEAGFKSHQETPHYQRWKETVAPWMAVPRVGDKHQSLYPEPWV
jgi:(4S)-4-hydroxy-5-phosphonooxypentane-2,3-dione isomerase